VTESERIASPLLGLAERLWNAEAGHAPISPLSDERPGLLPEEAGPFRPGEEKKIKN